MSHTRVAAVTGANKGIGLAIVRNLAHQYPTSPLNNPPKPLTIYLTSRSPERGNSALETLQSDSLLTSSKCLSSQGGLTTIHHHTLDISSHPSISTFTNFLHKTHPEGIDILINNAGIALDGFNIEIVKETLRTNYYGTLQMCGELLPLIRQNGRLINVSSMVGKLTPQKYSAENIRKFETAAKFPPKSSSQVSDVISQVTHEDGPDCNKLVYEAAKPTTTLMEDYLTAVRAKTQQAQGWPSAAYAVSKSGVTAVTKAIAEMDRQHFGQLGRRINAVCPGYVDTDMTKHRGRKSVDEGAEGPVWLAVGEKRESGEEVGTGGFWCGGQWA